MPRRHRQQQGHHAFRLQANAAITMYAQVLTRSPNGVARACRPLQLARPGSPGHTGRWPRRRPLGRGDAVVGEVKKVAIPSRRSSPLSIPSRLRGDVRPGSAFLRDRAVVDLGDHLLEQVDRPPNFRRRRSRSLTRSGPPAERRLDRAPRRPLQEARTPRPGAARPAP